MFLLVMNRDLYSVEELADFQAILAAADRETGFTLSVDLMTSRLWQAIDAGERDFLRLKAIVLGEVFAEPERPSAKQAVKSQGEKSEKVARRSMTSA